MAIMTLSKLKRQGRGASRQTYFRSLSADSSRSLDGNEGSGRTRLDDASSPSKYSKEPRPSMPLLSSPSTNTILATLILATQLMIFGYLILHSKLANTKNFDSSSLTLPAEIDAFFSSSSSGNGSRNIPSSSKADIPTVDINNENETTVNNIQFRPDAPRRSPPQSSLVPFDKLLEITTKELQDGAPRPTLIGSYSLGKDHILQKSLASSTARHYLNPDEITTGSIMFPFVDLANLMPEKKDVQLRGSSDKSGEGKQEDENDDKTLLAFGDRDSSFKSVLVHANKNIFSPDQAVLTRRGLKFGMSYNSGPTINQDRAFIANFNLELKQQQNEYSAKKKIDVEDQQQDQTMNQEEEALKHKQREQHQPNALLMGIFDGHGRQGQEVSHFAAVEFARVFASILRSKPITNSNSPDVIQTSQNLKSPQQEQETVQTISEALAFTFQSLDQREPIKGNSGSTASSLFYPGVGSRVYIANAGDSSTLIVRYSKSSRRTTIVFQSRKHTADLRDEANRIKNAGGYIMKPPPSLNRSPSVRDVSKVIISQRSPDQAASITSVGLALTTSRAIGDYDGKAEGITAEPEISVWDANSFNDDQGPEESADSEWFAIVGSDGLFDVLPPDIVAAYLSASLYKDEQDDSSLLPIEACERLIREASRLWNKAPIGGYRYRDDITLGVSKLYLNM